MFHVEHQGAWWAEPFHVEHHGARGADFGEISRPLLKNRRRQIWQDQRSGAAEGVRCGAVSDRSESLPEALEIEVPLREFGEKVQ
jgi:hypothetical protein